MYRKIIAAWVCVAWALWLGGLGALFLFVTHLFAIDRELAVKAAPRMFQVFERYQILLAAFALVMTAAWRFTTRSGRVTALFYVLAIAAVGAALGPPLVTHRMLDLWAAGQSSGAEFRKLHGESMGLYLGETVVLLAAGFLLPWALETGATKQSDL